MLEKLQQEFRQKMDALNNLRAASEAKSGAWSAEDQSAYDALLGEAQALKGRIEQAQLEGALRDWQNAPDGQSAVKAGYGMERNDDSAFGFSGEALNPGDGNIPGVFMKSIATEYDHVTRKWVVKGGELYAQDGNKAAEAKLKALNSGAYKDALVAYLRAAAKGIPVAGKHMKVLQEGIDSAGGNWVLPDMRNEIIQKQAAVMSVGNDVYRFSTGSDLVSFGKVTYSTDDKYTTGVRFSWTAEAPSSDVSEATNPVSGRVNIPIHTATAAIIVTRQLLEDAQFDILGFLSEKLGESFGLGLNDTYISGDGVGKPQGILTHANASVAHASGGMQVLSGASGAVAWGSSTTGVVGVETALPPQYETNARWYANKATYAAVRAINIGTSTLPQWSTGDSYPTFANGYQPTLLGFPIRRDQFMPDVGSANRPLMLGDMKAYYAPMRTGMTIDVLRELRALRDEVVIYARQRIGGQLVEDWRVKLMKSHNS